MGVGLAFGLAAAGPVGHKLGPGIGGGSKDTCCDEAGNCDDSAVR